jgi:hypothetical protein
LRELGLVPCQPRPWRRSLTEQGAASPIPDLVNRKTRLHSGLGYRTPQEAMDEFLNGQEAA